MKKIHKAVNKQFDSNFEENFLALWKAHSNYPIIHHHVVVLSRAWELDFAFIQPKICVELQGYGQGHISYLSMNRDYQKHNDLILAGWTILYFMSSDIKTPQPVITIKKLMEIKGVRGYNITQETDRHSEITDPLLIAARRLQNKRFN